MGSIFEINLLSIELKETNFKIYKELGVDVEKATILEATLNYPKAGVPTGKSIRPLKFRKGDSGMEFKYPTEERITKLKGMLNMTDIVEIKKELQQLLDDRKLVSKIKDINDLKELIKKLINAEQYEVNQVPAKQLLFKQEFEGDSFLETAITSTKKADVFEKGLLTLIGKGFTTAIGAITGVGVAVTAMGSLVTESLFNAGKSKKDKIIGIGYGIREISEKQIIQKLNDSKCDSLELEINLLVPEKAEKIIREYSQKGELTLRKKIELLQKGEDAGKVKINIKKTEPLKRNLKN